MSLKISLVHFQGVTVGALRAIEGAICRIVRFAWFHGKYRDDGAFPADKRDIQWNQCAVHPEGTGSGLFAAVGKEHAFIFGKRSDVLQAVLSCRFGFRYAHSQFTVLCTIGQANGAERLRFRCERSGVCAAHGGGCQHKSCSEYWCSEGVSGQSLAWRSGGGVTAATISNSFPCWAISWHRGLGVFRRIRHHVCVHQQWRGGFYRWGWCC